MYLYLEINVSFPTLGVGNPLSIPHPTDNTSPDLPKDVKLVMRLMRSFQPIKDILSRKLFPQDKPIRQLIHNKGLFVLYIEFVFEDCERQVQ